MLLVLNDLACINLNDLWKGLKSIQFFTQNKLSFDQKKKKKHEKFVSDNPVFSYVCPFHRVFKVNMSLFHYYYYLTNRILFTIIFNLLFINFE